MQMGLRAVYYKLSAVELNLIYNISDLNHTKNWLPSCNFIPFMRIAHNHYKPHQALK